MTTLLTIICCIIALPVLAVIFVAIAILIFAAVMQHKYFKQDGE